MYEKLIRKKSVVCNYLISEVKNAYNAWNGVEKYYLYEIFVFVFNFVLLIYITNEKMKRN